MTENICITAYKYQDLSREARWTVAYWLHDGDADLWEDVKEHWMEQLTALGYDDVDFKFSGFSSQGDGASIACKVDAQQFIKRHKLGRKFQSLLYWLRKEGGTGYIQVRRATYPHYVHQYMIDANADDMIHDLYTIPQLNDATLLQDHPAIHQAEELAKLVIVEVREWSMKIYAALQEEWDYRLSDEYMIETCDANEYLFDESGDPVHHLKVKPTAEVVAA